MDNNGLWPEGLIDVTDRLVIREFTADEAELCRNMYIRSGGRWDTDPAGLTSEEFRDFHLSYIKYQYGFYGYGNWGIYLKAPGLGSASECVRRSGTLIGIVGLVNGSASQVGELSYALLPEYRGKGYAYEACLAALEYGKECGFGRFEARIAADNLPSLKLAEKLGIDIINS